MNILFGPEFDVAPDISASNLENKDKRFGFFHG